MVASRAPNAVNVPISAPEGAQLVGEPTLSLTYSGTAPSADARVYAQIVDEKTGLLLPEGPYDTLAGYFMAQLGQLPEVGDTVTADVGVRNASEDADDAQLELTVTELDGRRAATFLVRRLDGGDFSPTPDHA